MNCDLLGSGNIADYVFGSVPYQQYLQENAYVRDITGHIKKSGETTASKISAQTREIVASNEKLSNDFGQKIDGMNVNLELGFERLEDSLLDVEVAIENLQSDFNYGIGLVLDQLQIQNQLTYGILEKLNAIDEKLGHPELTKAREFYNWGCDKLSKGLLNKALELLLKSERINDSDFFIQFQIGKLYLYGINEDEYVIDLIKAEQHLQNAARYGKAEISGLPEFKKLTGEALLHASISCYVQANDMEIIGNTIEAKEFILKAFQFAQEACEIFPSLSESQYHLAKYAAILGNVEKSIQSLEKSIIIDPRYILKIESDSDFNTIRPQVISLIKQLEAEKLAQAHENENSIFFMGNVKEFLEYEPSPLEIDKEEERKKIRKEKRRAKKLRQKNDEAEALKQERMRDSLCLVCGVKLGFFDKIKGKTTCSKH